MKNLNAKKSNESSYPFSFFESSKVTPIPNKDPFPELTQFKQLLNDEGLDQFYDLEKHQKSVSTYRKIFLSFALLFLFLMSLILFQKTTAFYSLYFGNGLIAKIILSSLCGGISLISIMISVKIRAEKEAIQTLFRQAKMKLYRLYTAKCSRIGWKRFLVYLHIHHQASSMIQAYYDAIENIQDAKDSAFALMDQIFNVNHVELTEKKNLVNQTIGELKDKLNRILHSFKDVEAI